MSDTELAFMDLTSNNVSNCQDASNPDNGAGIPEPLSSLTEGRKIVLHAVFCCALFLDSFNNCSLYSAIPPIAAQLDIPDSQSVWLLSAYQLTFAALLLISGRLSDLYNAKWVFVTGAFGMSAFSLIAGFMRSKLPLIVFRALMGAGAALTIPSALNLIVHMYPDPEQQAKAVATFGAMGGIGIVLGIIIGALFVSYASWPWVFFFSAIMAGVITLVIIFLVPSRGRVDSKTSRLETLLRFKRLDMLGVCLFAAILILFIFAVTSGGNSGWESASVIAPLVISAVLAVAFFVWEARLPEDYAALPPRLWRYKGFPILIAISLLPCMWWAAVFLLYAWYWEEVYAWSAIDAALHFLPIALGIFPVVPLAVHLQSTWRIKWVLFLAFVLAVTGTALLPFANSKHHYWPFAFPGFLLGTAGAAILYGTTNVAILAITPPSVAGVVSAVFNSALQTGVAAGVAIVTSIQTSVQKSHGGPNGYEGRAAGLWFLLALFATMMVLFLVFMDGSVGPITAGAAPGTAAENETARDDSESAKAL